MILELPMTFRENVLIKDTIHKEQRDHRISVQIIVLDEALRSKFYKEL